MNKSQQVEGKRRSPKAAMAAQDGLIDWQWLEKQK
jgi:hypothetical protein